MSEYQVDLLFLYSKFRHACGCKFIPYVYPMKHNFTFDLNFPLADIIRAQKMTYLMQFVSQGKIVHTTMLR